MLKTTFALLIALVLAAPVAGQTNTETVDKTLSLDGLPARADIIVAIDTTGSMGVPIAQAQADASNICATGGGLPLPPWTGGIHPIALSVVFILAFDAGSRMVMARFISPRMPSSK